MKRNYPMGTSASSKYFADPSQFHQVSSSGEEDQDEDDFAQTYCGDNSSYRAS